MLHQNVFDPVLLVGSADKLIPSDCHEGKHHKPYPIVGRHVLGKKRSPHLWSLEAHPLFSLSEIFFPISLYLTTYSVGIQSLWPQIHTRFDWWMIKHQTWVWNFCLRVFCFFYSNILSQSTKFPKPVPVPVHVLVSTQNSSSSRDLLIFYKVAKYAAQILATPCLGELHI